MRTFIIFLLFAINLYSQAPKTLNYQGYLTDAGGNSVSDGNQNITFRIYDVSTGGAALWTEARTVTTSDGVFSVILGEVTPIDLPFDEQYWLGITVGGSELSPRTKLASAPTAFNGTPTGVVDMFAGTTAPTGWLLCDGSAVSRLTYSNLFAVIGTAYGSGDGATTFNLPDFRGRFPRGVDNGAGNDPDAGSRTASNAGGNSGDNVGSMQEDAFQGHEHPLWLQTANAGGDSGNRMTSNAGLHAMNAARTSSYETNVAGHDVYSGYSTDGTNGTPRTSSETRPVNISVNFIIKY